jgi:hypothetical protein
MPTKKKNSKSDLSPPRRFFISYARGTDEDERLARYLYDQLTSAGHVAFLDTQMTLGSSWKEEIPRALADCDVFIVLLSERSVGSDMVLKEVMIAREHKLNKGRPRLAPIRVRFSEDLGYAMGGYLGPYQLRAWQSENDSPQLLKELLDLAKAEPGLRQAAVSKPAPMPRSTSPIADLKSIPAPGCALAPDHPMYLLRDADEEALSRIERRGETVVLIGARQIGKTSLLNRCLDVWSKQGGRFASVDLSFFDENKLEELPTLLQQLAKVFLHELGLPENVDKVTDSGSMTWFVEDQIIKPVGGPLVLAIDEVDRVFDKTYRSNFFGMIRGWVNARAKVRSPWKQVTIVLAISTEPHLLMVDRYQSPFNVTVPIRLNWFDLDRCHTLNERYGSPLEPGQVPRLHEFLGGHPYLTQLTLYELKSRNQESFLRFMINAIDPDSPFAPHLNVLWTHLQERPGLNLLDAMQRVVRYGISPVDDVAYRLQAAGLVRREENRVMPANELYARFFGRV